MSDSGDFDRETSYQSLDKRGLWLNKISYHKASSLNVSNSVRRSRSFGAGDIRRSRSFGAVDKRKGAVVTGERDEVGKGKIAIEIRPKMESSNSLVSVAERAEIRSRQRHANLRQKSQSSFEEQRKIFENNNNEASEKLHQNSLTSISSLRNDNNRKQSASDIISKIRQKQRLTSPNPSLTSIGMRGSVSREPVISHKTRETSLSDQENNCVIGKNASKVTIKTAHSRPVKFLPPESRSTVQSRQPGKSGTPSVTYQGAQQQHSVNSGSGSALRTKQNQQWPDHEGDQPDQERTISVVSERVKTLTLHSQKENHKQPGSSFHTGPRSAMFSSDKVGPKTSYRQEQRKAAKFSAQREKPQQNTRGEIYFPTKGHEHHTVDVDRTSDVSTGGIQRARTAGSNNSNVRQFTSKRGVKTTTKHSHSGGTERNNNNVHWATDSTSGSSEEDHIIDTDSSACNVIDERRRRRLVKRAKKRQSRGKKEEDRLQSQVSRFVEREIPHADSQASESGDDNLSRTSSIEVADVLSEDLMSPDEEKTKTKVKENYRANYRKAKQVFETNAPPPEHQIGPSSDGVNISSNPENSPVFARNRLANNIDNVPVPAKKSTGSKPCKENVMSQHNSLTSFSAFEMEAKNAKSKQQFNQIAKLGGSGSFTSVNKVAKITIPSFNSRLRSFSLGKKNIHSDTESYTSRIITSPFTTPSRKFRDMDERYSDGEHELTSRLEKAEQGFESDQGDWQFDLRRCNTLPRNMARDIAKNMQENPFQLSLPSRIRKEHTELLSNSQGTIENKVNLSSSPFTLSNPPNLKIQSKSTGSIEVNRDEFDKEIIQPKMKEEELSVESASTLTIEDSKESSGVTGVSKSSNTLESNQDLAMTYDEIGDEILRIANLVGSDRAFSPTIDNFSPNFEPVVPIIAPPDNFKDTPDVPLSSTSPPEKRESISEEQKSSPRSQRRGRPPPLPSQNSFELEIERDRADSPRRRPSYVIAQSSDLSVLPDFEKGDVIAESEESLISERTEGVGGMTGEQKDKRVSIGKRSRPRIPSVLDPLKAEDDHEKSSTDQTESGKTIKDENADETKSSDAEEIPGLDLKKVEKAEPFKRRPRPLLALSPMLEEIPEEKGGKDANGKQNRSEPASKKGRQARKHGSVLSPPGLSEDVIYESPEGRDSPKTDKSDKSETGYCSQSSDMLSPTELSLEDMTQDNQELRTAEAFKTSRVFDIFTADKTGDTNRSRSDPISGMTNNQAKLIKESVSERDVPTKWTSNSEPNLASSQPALPNDPRAVSVQEVATESQEKPVKGHARKSSAGSPEALKSSSATTFDTEVSNQRTDSQRSYASTPESPVPAPMQPKPKKVKPDMRRHVLQNLLETEKSYVQNLNYLVTMYYKPLKKSENSSIIEPAQVDEIFFQIPEILVNHEFFLEQLTNRVNNWTEKQIIGDIFVSSFTKCLLMDAYSTFINHYLQARATIRLASLRPMFSKFVEKILEQKTAEDIFLKDLRLDHIGVRCFEILMRKSDLTRRFLGMTKLPLLPIRKLPEVSFIGQQCCKDHKEKLTLQDLMIMPVQRIPRYVLILKDMLKHTSAEHPDYGLLQLALEEIKTLAERMNKGEMEADQAEKEAERLRDIEATIEGITDLVAANRKFIRQDLVAEIKGVITKKDRCLFLFSDLLVCATVRRKNNALRRGSLGLFSGQSATEFNRYKLLWKLPLHIVEFIKSPATNAAKKTGGDKQLEDDISVLGRISSMADTIVSPHQNLDAAIRELMAELSRQITEQSQTAQPMQTALTRVDLQAQTEDGTENFVFVFLSAEIKSSWEAYFEDAKQKLAYSRDTFPPEFQYPLPIDKTRSGMQFTCAAPGRIATFGDLITENGKCEVWVCNSDGYVGQVCLVSLVTDNHSRPCVTVCSARIQCISPVPGSRLVSPKTPKLGLKLPDIQEVNGSKKSPRHNKQSPHQLTKHKKSVPSESEEDDQPVGPENIIPFDSSDEEDGDMGNSYIGGATVFGGRMSPDGSSLGTVESVEGDQGSSADNLSDDNDSSDDEDTRQPDAKRRISALGSAVRRGEHGYTLKGSLNDLLGSDADEHPTMWLGTEDGSIYVYQANDSTQVRKSKMKIQLGAAVNSILYQENKVFVALASGELSVYKRDAGEGWDVATPQTIRVGPNGAPITCITAAAGRIWCGCQNNVILVNSTTLKVETTLTASQDPHRSIYRIVSAGLGVWISLQSSAVVRLYHATTFENLADIDVAPAVHKMLAGADAIIRQHKAACLRVTALLTCKDLLWIGTSAGVILTNPLPTITVNTHSLRHSPGPTGSPHGHTGHVRFLTSTEVPKSQFREPNNNEVTSHRGGSSPNKKRDPVIMDDNAKTVTVVVSGGDGYEDFRTSATSEAVGREDSTNHLLIWRV